MTTLHDVAPDLEGKLRRISLELEQGSRRDTTRSMSDNVQIVMTMEQEAAYFRRLSDE